MCSGFLYSVLDDLDQQGLGKLARRSAGQQPESAMLHFRSSIALWIRTWPLLAFFDFSRVNA